MELLITIPSYMHTQESAFVYRKTMTITLLCIIFVNYGEKYLTSKDSPFHDFPHSLSWIKELTNYKVGR